MRIYHEPGSRKHVENSFQGIDNAIAGEFDGIDIDNLLSRFGTWYACHWMEPLALDGYVDPKGELHHHARVDHMTNKQLDRLVTPDGYRMRRTLDMMKYTASHSDTLLDILEPKFDDRFAQDGPWANLRTMAQSVFGHAWAHRVQVRALWNPPIRAARRAGFKAWRIYEH